MKKTVILAVNDPHILYLLRRYAEETGLETVSASGGKDVLALLAKQDNSVLIILDAEPSGASGHRAWQGVRAEAAARRIPVVVYAQDETTEGAGRAESSAVNTVRSPDDAGGELPPVAGCLPKSVMYDDFVMALRRAGVCLEPVVP